MEEWPGGPFSPCQGWELFPVALRSPENFSLYRSVFIDSAALSVVS